VAGVVHDRFSSHTVPTVAIATAAWRRGAMEPWGDHLSVSW